MKMKKTEYDANYSVHEKSIIKIDSVNDFFYEYFKANQIYFDLLNSNDNLCTEKGIEIDTNEKKKSRFSILKE
jgi:hypothetical protein